MIRNLLFIFLSTFCLGFSQSNSINVITHNQVTIFTNPKTGSKSFTKWGIFPAKNTNVRRIIMEVTLAHPKDRAIAHWDYCDRINIQKVGGKFGESKNFEIGRMLTPYGSNFKKDWSFTWKVDITDFESFLRDSVEIEYIHTGYESPDLGWDLSIIFNIDLGTPIADFISIEEMWIGNFPYGNPENDIELNLTEKNILKHNESYFGRLRIQHTGHGMDQPNGCSEFCSRWREVLFDGKVIDHRNIWKECGDNPLYPQGGTWIFDRGYWCPGNLQIPDIIDVPLIKIKHTLNIDMESFTANNINQPKEVISSYFFQFTKPNHINDVRIEEIISPNLASNYNRFNPSGFNSTIIIRNLGSENLKKLTIEYGTENFDKNIYTWQGNLAFYEEEKIVLPGIINAENGLNNFTVKLLNPNDKEDEWKTDNILESKFENIPTLPTTIIVDFLTNNRPKDNTLSVINSNGDTVFCRYPSDLDSATNYLDTLILKEGNYALSLTDTTGDGLEFWFMPQSGYGRLFLKDIDGNLIYLFESDCGNGQFYSFRCDNNAKVDTTIIHLSVNIFPRMVKDYLSIYTITNKNSKMRIKITKDGEYIEQHEYSSIRESVTGMDVRHLEKGRYVMEIYINDEHKMNRRFNKI